MNISQDQLAVIVRESGSEVLSNELRDSLTSKEFDLVSFYIGLALGTVMKKCREFEVVAEIVKKAKEEMN